MPFSEVHSIELIIINALVLQNRVRIKSAHYLMHFRKKRVFHVPWSLISSLYILSILPSEIHLFSAFGSDWTASAFPLCYMTHVKQIPRDWRLEMMVPQIPPIDAKIRVYHVGDDSHRNRQIIKPISINQFKLAGSANLSGYFPQKYDSHAKGMPDSYNSGRKSFPQVLVN